MSASFTDEDLILYYYGELSNAAGSEIAAALSADTDLRARFGELLSLFKQMDNLSEEPAPAVIDRIIAEADHIHSDETAGFSL